MYCCLIKFLLLTNMYMNLYKVTKEFETELYSNVVTKIFPYMISNDKEILNNYLVKLINFISVYFGFYLSSGETEFANKYIKQFRKNEYKDPEELVMLLLPFINDPDFSNKERILRLENVYVDKLDDVDINKESPQYRFSNMQYNRCVRNNNIATERDFGYKDLEHNYQLLIDTVIRMANRLFYNWSDILPYTLADYKEDMLYKNTIELFNKSSLTYIDHVRVPDPSEHGYSLYIGHIYDNLSNNLFANMTNYRWLIYDVIVDNKVVSLFPLINEILKIDVASSWETVSNEYKTEFMSSINNMLENDTVSIKSIISKYHVRKIMIAIAFYFTKYYSNGHNIEFIKLGEESDDDDDEEQQIHNYMGDRYRYVIATIKSIPIENLYDFIIESYNSYKGTWYWLYLTSDNVILQTEVISDKIQNSGFTPKNVYNFAKSFTHYTVDTEFLSYDRYWSMLNNKSKKEIINRLNDKNNSGWFNIKRYIRKLYEINDDTVDARNDKIYRGIRNNIIDIVFETMIINGCLTKFSPDIYLTDYDNDKFKSYNDRLRESIDVNRFDTGFNFTTNKMFRNSYVNIEIDGKEKKVKYVEYMITGRRADNTKIATLNWTSQLLFYHKYINNRVVLVTGGTGVGKSSQVPKLALYSLKTIDYKNSGNVICTQPTISSTINGAKNMSNDLGVQIDVVLNKDGAAQSSNYVIQFEYKDKQKSHISKTHDLMLKFCTDGILFKIVQSNPLLLHAYKRGTRSTISNRNVFDIVMIDESHTHNMNMDLILTLMKYAVYYNNSIKLFIISATMDDDEPYYRRFYRDINDNKMYPLNNLLKEHNLDRVSVDRRYHVGTKLRYKVTEIYKPEYDIFDAVREIMRTSTDGDILIFQTGAMEINQAVAELNKIVPADVLALPLFSAMVSREKDKIFEFHKYRSKIVARKGSDFKEIEIGEKSPYNRFIIVATNVVEASITISSLQFVIDNGFYKSMRYDHKTYGTISNDRTEISEQSRLQRKGRVGRVAPGTVYYLYKKHQKEKIRQDFNIASSDIHPILYSLLVNDREEDLFTDENNPQNITKVNKRDLKSLYKNGLDIFIGKHYFSNNSFWEYRGNDDMYDYNNCVKPIGAKDTGFDSRHLNDSYGEFYIVHPEERNFYRNILGTVVNTTDEIVLSNTGIVSKKMSSFWKILKDYMLVFGDKELYKTKYGEKIFKIANILTQLGTDLGENFSYGFAISYVYSLKYRCPKFLKVIALYYATMLQPKLVYRDNLAKGSCYGDTVAMLDVIDELDKYISRDTKELFNKTLTDFPSAIQDLSDEFLLQTVGNSIKLVDMKNSSHDTVVIRDYYNMLRDMVIKIAELEKTTKTVTHATEMIKISNLSADLKYNYNLSMMHGFCYNLSINIGKKYQRLVELLPDNVYTLEPRNLLFTCQDAYDYVLFFNINPDSKQISVIHGLHEADVMSLSHIFNKEYVRDKFLYLKTTNITGYYSNLKSLRHRINKFYKDSNLNNYDEIDDRQIFREEFARFRQRLNSSYNCYLLSK